MADVNAHSQPLGFLYIFPAQIGKPAAGDVGAGKGVLFVPAQARHPEADGPQVFQQRRVIVDACRSLQGQNGGHFAICPVFLNFVYGIGNGNQVAVFVHLPLDGGKLPLEQDNRGNPMQQLRNVRGEAGEALGIAPQLDRPLQVDMTAIFPQAARLIQVVPQQHKCGITVKIKYRKVH